MFIYYSHTGWLQGPQNQKKEPLKLVVNQCRNIWRLQGAKKREEQWLKLYLQQLHDLEAQETRLSLYFRVCVCVSLTVTSAFMRPLCKHLLSLLYIVKALIYDKRGAL